MDRAYESIVDVINDRTEKKGNETIDYYEAVRIAYTESEYMRKYFNSPKSINNLNKHNKACGSSHIEYSKKKRNALKL
jgi:hypothetical protein